MCMGVAAAKDCVKKLEAAWERTRDDVAIERRDRCEEWRRHKEGEGRVKKARGGLDHVHESDGTGRG